jgi:uncharacterized membrane protein
MRAGEVRSLNGAPDTIMKSLLQNLGRAVDVTNSTLIWLRHGIFLFLGLVWVVPLFAVAVVSAFVYDLRPMLRDSVQNYVLYSLFALPPWLALCLYARFGMTIAASRIKDWMTRMPAFVGYVVLGAGGLLWLLGIL